MKDTVKQRVDNYKAEEARYAGTGHRVFRIAPASVALQVGVDPHAEADPDKYADQ